MEHLTAPSGVLRRARGRLAGLLAGVLVLAAAQAAPAATAADHAPPQGGADRAWVGTWAASPTAVPPGNTTSFRDQTLRQVVHASVGGDAVRVRLTNEFGSAPLVIGEARVARPDDPSGQSIDPATDRALTFGGRTSVTVPPGSPVVSDPVRLRLPAGGNLVVSVHLPRPTPASTVHGSAFQRSFVAEGNVTGAADIEPTAIVTQWHFLSGVSVRAAGDPPGGPAAVVALGDSITDGAITEENANHRWPDLFAERLRATPGLRDLGVLNAGIGGNRLLHDPNPPAGSPAEEYAAYFGQSALKRFDRDVAAQPGARHLVVLLGVNDLGHPGTVAPESERVSAADLIAGHRELIARAHARGMKVYGATITPFRGDTLGFFSPSNEAARQAVNRWIRTGGEYDGVIDFDAAVRDPQRPDTLLAAYDSGDHLHPNDAGMAAMARAVPLRLFR
ncbi:SGNH/GDSL hydrolase family protein [Streptomyces capparidis]